MSSVFLGIDFGTSNSSIAYVKHDPRDVDRKLLNVHVVQLAVNEADGTKSGRMPTVVSASAERAGGKWKLHVGWQHLVEMLKPKRKAALVRHGRTLFTSVKSDLGMLRVYADSEVDEVSLPEDAAAKLLSALLAAAAEELQGHDVYSAKVVLTVPASLGQAARKDSLAAAELAGLLASNVEFIDEPVAALIDVINSPMASDMFREGELRRAAVYDLGGGTLDIAVVRAAFDLSSQTGLIVENLAISEYCRLGGDRIDEAIMDDVLWPQVEKELGELRSDLPRGVARSIADTLTHTVARSVKEEMCRECARRLKAGAKWNELRVKCPDAIGAFKDRAYEVPGFDKIPKRFGLSFDEFAAVMNQFVGGEQPALLAPLIAVLEKADLGPSDLDVLVLHGSGCKNPFVRRMIDDFVASDGLFARTQVFYTPDLDASVARGAAAACYWKHKRGVEIIAPITAEPVGIMTLHDRPVQLIPAGTKLPYPDAESLQSAPMFHVPADNMSHVVVPWFVGHDQRRAGVISVPLQKGLKSGHPITIKFRIDRDKLVEWYCQAEGKPPVKADVVADPWSATSETPETAGLAAVRREMKDDLAETGVVGIELRLSEIKKLWRCEYFEEALLLIDDLIEAAAGTAVEQSTCYNLRGLVLEQRGEFKAAVASLKMAVALDPADGTGRGNLGWLLADMGAVDEAVPHLRAGISLAPTYAELYERLSQVYRDAGDEASARSELEEGLRHGMSNAEEWNRPRDWHLVARVARQLGKYKVADAAERTAVLTRRAEELGANPEHVIAGPDSGIYRTSEFGE